MKLLDPDDLVPMNLFERDFPLHINLIYAQPNNPDNHFGQLYHPEASLLWLHKDMAQIVLQASRLGYELFGWSLELLDGLRPVEAQEEMTKFGIPWQMLARPGQGGHPRAMAIDIFPHDRNGNKLDMGTPFDQFVEDYERDINYADRSITAFGKSPAENLNIWENRSKLTYLMLESSRQFNRDMFPLPHEWWDFRFPNDLTDQYAPLSEADLHPYQRLITPDLEQCQKIRGGDLPFQLKARLSEVSQSL